MPCGRLRFDLGIGRGDGVGYWKEGCWRAEQEEGVRVRIHEFDGPTFSALMQIEVGSASEQNKIDAVITALLKAIGAAGIKEIEPYD